MNWIVFCFLLVHLVGWHFNKYKKTNHETEGPWLAPTNRTDADCLALVVVLDGFASARRKWFTEVSASSSSSDGVWSLHPTESHCSEWSSKRGSFTQILHKLFTSHYPESFNRLFCIAVHDDIHINIYIFIIYLFIYLFIIYIYYIYILYSNPNHNKTNETSTA